MPRIDIYDPSGFTFTICSRNQDTIKAWFDEVLPHVYWEIDSPLETIYANIRVFPMFSWEVGIPKDPDWLQDTRVIGDSYPFHARNGEEGIRELAELRKTLEEKLKDGR